MRVDLRRCRRGGEAGRWSGPLGHYNPATMHTGSEEALSWRRGRTRGGLMEQTTGTLQPGSDAHKFEEASSWRRGGPMERTTGTLQPGGDAHGSEEASWWWRGRGQGGSMERTTGTLKPGGGNAHGSKEASLWRYGRRRGEARQADGADDWDTTTPWRCARI